MTTTTTLSWADVRQAARNAATDLRANLPGDQLSSIDGVYGVPRGGVVPAVMIADLLNLPLLEHPTDRCLVVDDLVDSGSTLAALLDGHSGRAGVALFQKTTSPERLIANYPLAVDGWLLFPWEQGTAEAAGPTDAVTRLLEFIGEDPTRPGLIDTPARVVKALAEMTQGYGLDPAAILERRFPDTCDEMVVVRDIAFTSMCEHHMLGFNGVAHVAYVPNGSVVGLSKIPRLVDALSQRLQVQERLTEQIADAMEEHLNPFGVGVVLQAAHSCMGCRGVRKPGASMVTSAMRGYFKDKHETRAEFLQFIR